MLYLLHIVPPYKHARHYTGYAENVYARLAEHRAGRGARLTQVAIAAGCKLILVRTWEGDRTNERQLKNNKNAPRFCPLCNQVHDQTDLFLEFDLTDVPELAF